MPVSTEAHNYRAGGFLGHPKIKEKEEEDPINVHNLACHKPLVH